ncbi:alpha/beta hydrolase [Caulobacter soli]|uniref:alpha/beta hydrolase n=1 Tax=Caulobacter soli TaxID=2708539 RepID=UPI0013EB6F97|nr:alpha/beta hydrolase [Caulobacter soli]
MIRSLAAMTLATFATFATDSVAVAAPPKSPVSIVLVHGAFVDASGWKAVYDKLTSDGYEVLVVQNSTETLEGDVNATQRAIAAAKNPVVLVGHSYGGMVITQAGADPKVRTLVYIAAFAPDVGESVESLSANPPPNTTPPPIVAKDGFLRLDETKFPGQFAQDVPIATTRFLAAAQVPWGQAALTAKVTTAAWKSKPTYYVLTVNDMIVPPVAQRQMAQRASAKIIEVKSSHAAMLAQPAAVAAAIETAAQ